MRKSLFKPIYDEFLKKEGFSCKLFQETFPETIGVITHPQIRSRRNLLTCGVKRKTRIKTYSENRSKRLVQMILMDFFKLKGAEVVALLGPSESYEEYVRMLDSDIKPSSIQSWENDINIFTDQEKSKNNSKINFNFGDVRNCEPTNYMDIDLKCSYKTCKDMIISLFNKQKFLTGDKVFNFSYSVNWLDSQSVDNVIINSIQDLVGKKVFLRGVKVDPFPMKKTSIREYIIDNYEDFIVKAFWYYDSSPMVSISIFSSDKIVCKTREEKVNYVIRNIIGINTDLNHLSDNVLDLHIARYVLQAA